jgi:Co/Zn/Cd efflux system component
MVINALPLSCRFFNAVILFVAVGFIVYEAVQRLLHPENVTGTTIAWVAFSGIAINGFTAWLFVKDKDTDLNIKGAYIHMAVDAIVSLGVVISGVIIYFSHWYWVDSAVSIIIAIVILTGTWSLLKDSLRLGDGWRTQGDGPGQNQIRTKKSRRRGRCAPHARMGTEHHRERPHCPPGGKARKT